MTYGIHHVSIIQKPVVASLAGDVEVEEAAEYLFDHGIPACAYSQGEIGTVPITKLK